MGAEQFVNFSTQRLMATIDAVSTTLQTSDGAKLADPGRTGRLILGNEVCKQTDRAGDLITVVRGAEGTIAVPHAVGTPIIPAVTAEALVALGAAGGAVINGAGVIVPPVATGNHTLVGGSSAADNGFGGSIVLGDTASAGAAECVVIGDGASTDAASADSVAIGAGVSCSGGSQSVAVGGSAVCIGSKNTTVGWFSGSNASGTGNTCAGWEAGVFGDASVAVGIQTVCTSTDSVAIGDSAFTDTGLNATAVGAFARTGGTFCDAFGSVSFAESPRSLAMHGARTHVVGECAFASANVSPAGNTLIVNPTDYTPLRATDIVLFGKTPGIAMGETVELTTAGQPLTLADGESYAINVQAIARESSLNSRAFFMQMWVQRDGGVTTFTQIGATTTAGTAATASWTLVPTVGVGPDRLKFTFSTGTTTIGACVVCDLKCAVSTTGT